MITTNINGIDVKFPFEPYSIQKDYMRKVIDCLDNEKNGVLESPTGTGKTLSLLCSSLAWLEAKKSQLRTEKESVFVGKGDEFLTKFNKMINGNSSKNARRGMSFLGVPTIIYASRTHSQLSQAVNEMRYTAYNNMNACVLGSREQLCIHPEVVKELNNNAKIAMCNVKTNTRTCHFYNNYQKAKEQLGFIEKSITDIEDLVTLGKTHRYCPYFMSKEFKNGADIIFMPYNYLLEPKFRKTLGIELTNTIVILDEAHNVEKICEESASLQLKSVDLALAIEEVKAAVKLLDVQGMPIDERVEADFTPSDLENLSEILLKLQKEIEEIPFSNNSENNTFPGLFMFELLLKAGIQDNNQAIIINLLEKLAEFLSVSTEDGPFQKRGNGLKLISDALNVIFLQDGQEFKQRVDKCYKVHITEEEIRKGRSSSQKNRVLSYWCFSPGFGMKMLMDQGVRCCILTSGTLAPLKPLITELEFNNPVHLENPHVVKDDQVYVRIISQGPDGEKLSCTYANRDNESYLRSLGFTLMNLTRLIPNGLLIFFPSYPIMNNCKEYWQKQGVWSGIDQQKNIYTESKTKETFTNTMNEYYEKIKDPNSKGAIFMGVCRGKLSEGLDFVDLNGRAVVIIGLPFPPLKDPKIILKKRYLDNCRLTNQEYVSGDKWYTLEACRAVNQAIGRVIRHKNDYGAILLLDERYKNNNIQSHISSWLRNRMKVAQSFREIAVSLRQFYISASKEYPVQEKNREKTENVSNSVSNKWLEFSQSFSSETSQESVASSSSLENYRKRTGQQIMRTSKKLKIKLIPNASSIDGNEKIAGENETISDPTKEYIVMVRKVLDATSFKAFVEILKQYKNNKDINVLIETLEKFFMVRQNLWYLLQGVERYVDEKHKKKYQDFYRRYI